MKLNLLTALSVLLAIATALPQGIPGVLIASDIDMPPMTSASSAATTSAPSYRGALSRPSEIPAGPTASNSAIGLITTTAEATPLNTKAMWQVSPSTHRPTRMDPPA